MTKKELANEIRELVIGNEFLGEGDEDINSKIIDLLRANLKSLVEIDEGKILDAIREHSHPQSGSLFIENFKETAKAIAKENPIKWKEGET